MRKLLLVPFGCAVMTAAGMWLERSTAARLYEAILVLTALVTAISAFVTTGRFSRGDRLFGSWALLGIAYALSAVYFANGLLGRVIHRPNELLSRSTMFAILIVVNIAIAGALLMFVLAWSATGLAQWRSWLVVAGIVIAVIVGGLPLADAIQRQSLATGMLVSTVGDVVGLSLIVPLALSAFALRGGLLVHTWLYLALSELSWLLYDLWLVIRGHVVAPRFGDGISVMIEVLAIMFAFVATVAQRRALVLR